MNKPQNITTIMPIVKINRSWHLIDLEGQTLGRVASQNCSSSYGKTES